MALDFVSSRKKHAKIVSGNFLFNDETNTHKIHDRGYTGERTTVEIANPNPRFVVLTIKYEKCIAKPESTVC